jgi:RNA polymerase sigma-B factor
LRNQLVEDHLALARGFARRYRGRGVSQDDLEQVARLGLIGAVERFDPSMRVRFETFAGRTIDGELKRHFRDKAWSVRVPRQYQELGIAIRAALDGLSKDLGRSPTIPELARAVGADVDEVLAAMEASQAFQADSIDAPVGGDGEEMGTTLAEALGDHDAGPSRVDDRALVVDLLSRLPERERRIVELRFFGERSQRDIAEEVGVSQMHVSRLLRKAISSLREAPV